MPKLSKNFNYAAIATDVVMFTVHNQQLKVLLIEMKKKPFVGYWAVPGGMVNPEESVDASAQRHLSNKAGIKDIYLEQLYTFGDVDRDPFGRVVSVAYFSLIPDADKFQIKTTRDYADISWHNVDHLPKMAYDHRNIIKMALDRLRAKLEYTNVVYSLLPTDFTLAEMQQVYEVILGKNLDKRNFRKKILSLNMVEKTGKKTEGTAHRPADMYKFTKKSPQIVQIL